MNWDVSLVLFLLLLRGDALGRKPIIFFGATIIILVQLFPLLHLDHIGH